MILRTLAIYFLAIKVVCAFEYIKSTSESEIEVIDLETFEKQCPKIIFRSEHKESLSLKHKRLLLKAMIRGDSIGSYQLMIERLKADPGSCSYRLESEK